MYQDPRPRDPRQSFSQLFATDQEWFETPWTATGKHLRVGYAHDCNSFLPDAIWRWPYVQDRFDSIGGLQTSPPEVNSTNMRCRVLAAFQRQGKGKVYSILSVARQWHNLLTARRSARRLFTDGYESCWMVIPKRKTKMLRNQNDGNWCGELEGDTILESEYILLLAWLGRERSEVAKKAANYIVQKQLPCGGWSMYPGGDVDISGSVKAYFALKLTGHSPAAEYMQRARRAILEHGGADAVNSFTRFYLALLGQISYEHCPAVPPEAVLLPARFPLSIYQISAWSRTILVPLSIMWARRPQRQLSPRQGIVIDIERNAFVT